MERYYLKDNGIYKKGNKYYYNKNNLRVESNTELTRLNSFVVPPAWTSVWYASTEKSHIQVHGIDVGGKKQYILSEKWNSTKRKEKYQRIRTFVNDLQEFKQKIKLNESQFKITKDSIIKLLFNLLISTHIRVGNEIYAIKNKTYGLTTLKQKHLTIDCNNNMVLQFVGKSNIKHSVTIPSELSPYIKRLINSNKNGPLFYYNSNKVISSNELNEYLKNNMGNYTCKDFRTYSANVLFIESFLKNSKSENNITKRLILKCIDESAEKLGHTRTICKKSYISESLINYCMDHFSRASNESVESLIKRV